MIKINIKNYLNRYTKLFVLLILIIPGILCMFFVNSTSHAQDTVGSISAYITKTIVGSHFGTYYSYSKNEWRKQKYNINTLQFDGIEISVDDPTLRAMSQEDGWKYLNHAVRYGSNPIYTGVIVNGKLITRDQINSGEYELTLEGEVVKKTSIVPAPAAGGGAAVGGGVGGAAGAGIIPAPAPGAVSGFLGKNFGGFPTDFKEVVEKILTFIFGAAGVIFVILFIVGGIMYLTSGGNEEAATKAKKLLLDAVVGIIIVVGAWAISSWILVGVGGSFGL